MTSTIAQVPHPTQVPQPATRGSFPRRPPFAVAPVLGIAAALVAVELAVAARYGLHRDELYFLAGARHLAWGYVDQPPFVPAVARLSVALFGSSAVALRVFPALGGGVAVVFTGLMARELGGGRRAQLVAALAAATSAQVLSTVHLLSTAAFDLMLWSAVTLLVLRLLRGVDPRWWLALGAVCGVALLNKYNVGFLLVALIVGVILAGRGRLLLGPWPFAGAVLALVIWSPNLVWNAQHQWASVAMLRSLHQENSTVGAALGFVPSQFLVVGPALIALWVAGVWFLWRHPFARPLAIAFLTLLVLYTLAGAKSYYLGGFYFVLFAAGGVWADERLARRSRPGGTARLAIWMIIGSALVVWLALPILPATSLAKGPWESTINKDLSATVGWERVTRQIADVKAELPPDERSRVVVFTGDYGAAGAVDEFGARYGLPHAISGHNNYWLWGPAGASNGATTIAINLPRSYLQTIFSDVAAAGTVDTGFGVWTEERGAPIWVCRHQRLTWARAWPNAKRYG